MVDFSGVVILWRHGKRIKKERRGNGNGFKVKMKRDSVTPWFPCWVIWAESICARGIWEERERERGW